MKAEEARYSKCACTQRYPLRPHYYNNDKRHVMNTVYEKLILCKMYERHVHVLSAIFELAKNVLRASMVALVPRARKDVFRPRAKVKLRYWLVLARIALASRLLRQLTLHLHGKMRMRRGEKRSSAPTINTGAPSAASRDRAY